MADNEKRPKLMTWKEKIAAAQKVMAALEAIDIKDGDREQELCDIIEIVLKLLLPIKLVGLLEYRRHSF